MGLPSFDDNWWDDSGSPEAIASDEPTCPHCGLVHDMPGADDYYKIDCDCGWSFDVQRKTVVVSSPREHRE